jgi:hypothetical protein
VPDVEFAGERFTVVQPGMATLMDFAEVAMGGVDSNDMAGVVALKGLLRECVAEDEWDRFWALAKKSRATGDELMIVVQEAVAALAERPTLRPSDSSDGPRTTPPRSEDDSSSRVIARLEEKGRPDLALVVARTQGLTA